MKTIDHIALCVEDPEAAASWYIDNIKMAFVKKGTHPAHFAFEVENFSEKDSVKTHRDNTLSTYKKDPWGNIFELIKYPEKF